MTSNALLPVNSVKLTVLPEAGCGSEKSGAGVPSSSMVDSVRAMMMCLSVALVIECKDTGFATTSTIHL